MENIKKRKLEETETSSSTLLSGNRPSSHEISTSTSNDLDITQILSNLQKHLLNEK